MRNHYNKTLYQQFKLIKSNKKVMSIDQFIITCRAPTEHYLSTIGKINRMSKKLSPEREIGHKDLLQSGYNIVVKKKAQLENDCPALTYLVTKTDIERKNAEYPIPDHYQEPIEKNTKGIKASR